MALLIGILLAILVGVFATGLGLDRDLALYPVVMIVIASLYALFTVMGESTHTLVLESLVGAVFIAVAASGFRWALWAVVAALAAHGIYFANARVPVWSPTFCLTYEVTAAAYLARLLKSGRMRAAA